MNKEFILALEELEKEANEIRITKGLGCLIQLIQQKEHWLPSEVIKKGLYKENNSNQTEGTFGNIKNMCHHKSCLYIHFLV